MSSDLGQRCPSSWLQASPALIPLGSQQMCGSADSMVLVRIFGQTCLIAFPWSFDVAVKKIVCSAKHTSAVTCLGCEHANVYTISRVEGLTSLFKDYLASGLIAWTVLILKNMLLEPDWLTLSCHLTLALAPPALNWLTIQQDSALLSCFFNNALEVDCPFWAWIEEPMYNRQLSLLGNKGLNP